MDQRLGNILGVWLSRLIQECPKLRFGCFELLLGVVRVRAGRRVQLAQPLAR